jgi:hypothetical protein
MARNLRRADPNKRDEIRAVFQTCKEAGLSDEDSLFFTLNMVKDGTLPEWCWARYYREVGADNPPDRDFLNLYRQWERWFNQNDRNPGEEIIGIKKTVKNKKGKIVQIWFRGLAIGEGAETMAKFCDVVMNGWKSKQTRLYGYARDPDLQARHQAKFQELRRRITQFKRRRRAGKTDEEKEDSS